MATEVKMAQELEELLAAHADDLNRGVDTTDGLTVQYAALFPELPALLHLGRLLKKALVPVEPRSIFVHQLRGQLLHRVPADAAPESTAGRIIVLGAAVGSLLSLAGMVLLLVRLLARRAAPTTSTL